MEHGQPNNQLMNMIKLLQINMAMKNKQEQERKKQRKRSSQTYKHQGRNHTIPKNIIYQNAQYNFDVQDSIYATEHCLRNQDGSHICINRKDIRGLYQEPNYDTRKICIGDTCLNKKDIIILKNMSQDTLQDVNLNAKMAHSNRSTGFIKSHTDNFKENDITLFKNNAVCQDNLINEYFPLDLPG